jgi:hypothetical protein
MGRYTYYCASYWHRDCEPSSVAVILAYPEDHTLINRTHKAKLEVAILDAMAEERSHCLSCDYGCGCEDEATCEICEPDLCWSGVGQEPASSLFTPKELMAHRRNLLAGHVVWLERG